MNNEGRKLQTARLISQYLVRCGHLDIAKDVSDHFDVAHMLDFDVFQSAKQVILIIFSRNIDY